MLKRSRFYVEEDEHLDEEDIDTTETEEESDDNDTEDSDDGGFESINFDASKDEYDMDEDIAYGDENVDDEDVKSKTPTTMAVDVDITTMGSDNSPVQNQYSPKEIERLNVLLASENSAIGEYFQASKETNVDILRRLYSDIGEEERFHSEQLLFAKSQLTGEPYVPRDPDVKKEYEELLALGMDEETAMTTAIDKVGISSKTGMSPEEASQQLESVVEDMEFIQRSLYQEYVLMNIMITPEYNRERLLKTYTEAYINQTLYNVDVVMEDVVNNVENPPAKKGILRTIISIIHGIGTGIRKIFENITKWFDTVRANSKARLAWFKNHSLLDLFKSGLNLYFFDEKTQTFDFESPLKYLNRITQCATSIKNKLGVEVNPSGTYHDWDEKYIDVSADIDTIDSKVDMLSKVKMIKMKVMFNNDPVRKTFIENVFCGQSDSVFNEFRKLIKSFNLTLTYVKEIAEATDKLSENSNSIYYSNRNEYDRYVKILKTITDCCNKFISALTNDLSEMIKASKYIDNAMKNEIAQKEPDEKKNTSKYIKREIANIQQVLSNLDKEQNPEAQQRILTNYIAQLEKLKASINTESYMYRVSSHSRFYSEAEVTAQPASQSQQASEDDKTTIQALIDLAKSLLELAKQKTPDKMKSAIDSSVDLVRGFVGETSDKIRSGITNAINRIKAIKNGDNKTDTEQQSSPTPQQTAQQTNDTKNTTNGGTDAVSQQTPAPTPTQNGGGTPAEPTATNAGTNGGPQSPPTPTQTQNVGKPASQRKDANYLEKTYGKFVDEHAKKLRNFQSELKRIKTTERSIRKDGDGINHRLDELRLNVNNAKAIFDRMYNKFREDAGLPTKSLTTESYYFQEWIFGRKNDHPVDSAISSVADKFREVENGYNDILTEIGQKTDKVNPLTAERNERDERAAQRQQFHDENNDQFSSQATANRERKNGTIGSEEAMRVAAAKDPEYTGRERWDDRKRYGVIGRHKLKKTPEGISELYAVNRASINYLIGLKDAEDPKSKRYADIQFLIERIQLDQQKLAEKYQRMTGKTIEEFYIPRYISKDIIQEYVSAIESEITEDPLFGYFS